jgi:hypothetical protein
MPSYKNAKEAKKAMSGASMKKYGASVDEETDKQKREKARNKRKAQKKADRIERRKHGTIWTRKSRKKKMALAAREKERAKENLETVASKKTNEAVGYTEDEKSSSESSGVSMKKPNMSRPAKKLEYIQGSSMGYGKKHGSSMNKYDKKMMHLREQISDDKKAIHRTDQAKKSHAHPIFKHMRKF